MRRFESSDVECVFKNWASDEEVQALYSEPTYKSVEETKELLNKYIDNYKNSNYYRFAIILKENNQCIGQIAYFLGNEKNHFAEIEYCIGREFQGYGYATEATKRIISFGFEEMNLHKVQICHKEMNEKSKSVIKKCGVTYEGTLRDFFFIEGENKYVSRLYYSILKSEYESMVCRR